MNQVITIVFSIFCVFFVLEGGSQSTGFKEKPHWQAAYEEEFRHQPNNDFPLGERFEYLAHYGFINAGKGVVSMKDDMVRKKNRDCYEVAIDARTIGMFALGVKVRDRWVSYIDESAIMPHEFYRDISENKYKLTETTQFDQKRGTAVVNSNKKGKKSRKTYEIPTYTQDMVSGYYYLRTLSYENMKKGDVISMNAFFEDKLYDFKVRFEGKGVVKTKFGKVHAFKIKPIMPDNKLFKGKDAITIWVSDDINRVPLKIDVNMFVGTFEVEIVDYKGLREEFNWAK